MPEAAAPARVTDEEIADLRRRLRAWREIPALDSRGQDRGISPGDVRQLVEHWAESYRWRDHEQRIRGLPWTRTDLPGTTPALLQRATRLDAPVVVLLHGWPDSVLRYERVLPLLRDVHVVVPALPGFPWGAAPDARNGSAAAIARTVRATVTGLGFDRYIVSGGDIGAIVAEAIAAAAPYEVAALHLTDIPTHHLDELSGIDLDPEQRRMVDHAQHWFTIEGAYVQQQRTKPGTLTLGLGDSPVGLLAWLIEKYWSWADGVSAFDTDDLLTWVSAYWFTRTIGTSFAPYADAPGPVGPLTTPTTVSAFRHDLIRWRRSYAARFYDLRHGTVDLTVFLA